TTEHDQRIATVALDSGGGFVVAWQGSRVDWQGMAYYDVYGRRFSAGGAPQGAEFRVNTTLGYRRNPQVSMNQAGASLFIWWGEDTYARMYQAGGTAVGGESVVESSPLGQLHPVGAIGADGRFVSVWAVYDGGSQRIAARQFSGTGVPAADAFWVTTQPTTGMRDHPQAAVDAGGNVAVVWRDYAADGSNQTINARLYTASGTPRGPVFRVDEDAGGKWAPRVTYVDGDLVFAWISYATGRSGVYARRYSASGDPQGVAFQVDTATPSGVSLSTFAVSPSGTFVVAGTSTNARLMAQAYSAEGHPEGDAFQVNGATGSPVREPAVAENARGDIIVVWESAGQDGSGYGVYARQYQRITAATETEPASRLALSVTPSPVDGAGGRVRYAVPDAGPVHVSLYDALGREVAVLIDGVVAAGEHEASLDGAGLAPGVYVLRLAAGAETLTHRLTVVR
ncbi:MAG TPA: T9SS type A sorting domain-containing protein, partial [Rhodothermales bacterium]|nr:T9SS type A sorting domain-containing protein [Rhodothermales bacterium]